MPDWWRIREAEANIQGSAGFGPKQYMEGGVGGGLQGTERWVGGARGAAGKEENEMLPGALIRQAKDASDVFPWK